MAEKYLRFDLQPDKQGMIWDLLLYIPTVFFLLMLAFKLWYTSYQTLTYVLLFSSTFFTLYAGNRILKTRLMTLPTAPVSIELMKDRVRLGLRSGATVDLVKDVRFYPDFAGKSFALVGHDLSDKVQKHVFHRGQFSDESMFKDARSHLDVYRARPV